MFHVFEDTANWHIYWRRRVWVVSDLEIGEGWKCELYQIRRWILWRLLREYSVLAQSTDGKGGGDQDQHQAKRIG